MAGLTRTIRDGFIAALAFALVGVFALPASAAEYGKKGKKSDLDVSLVPTSQCECSQALENFRKVGGDANWVELENGFAFVQTSKDSDEIQKIQQAAQQYKQTLDQISQGKEARVSDECRQLLQAMKKDQAQIEVRDLETSAMAIVTSDDPSVKQELQQTAQQFRSEKGEMKASDQPSGLESGESYEQQQQRQQPHGQDRPQGYDQPGSDQPGTDQPRGYESEQRGSEERGME